jgi:uncharacterized protein YegP (UPF0339 family)
MDALGGFASANDLAKQLITLATGILALSITFIKDILKNHGQIITRKLNYAWLFYLLSVLFGILEMMAIAGSISGFGSNGPPHTIYDTNVRIPAFLQITTFLLGTLFLIIYGSKMLGLKSNVAEEAGVETKQITAVAGATGGDTSMKFHIRKEHTGEWRWQLKGANGQEVANSDKGYSSNPECKSDIDLIRGTTNIAVIEDD